MKTLLFAVMLAMIASTAQSLSAAQDAPSGPNLIPWPKSVKMETGTLALTPASRIVATDVKLDPLARILSDEIFLAANLRLAAAQGPAKAGDIVLEFSPTLKGEAYELQVTDKAVVRGGNYGSVAWGTVTLLQALAAKDAKVALPCMTIADDSDATYRGYMKDCARQELTIEELQSVVNLCRLYKVRYIQLHLNDDHAWTFPSKAFPTLGSTNRGAHSGPSPKVYDLDQLKALVRYADERGVTFVPELEGPGHTDALRVPMPELFDSPQTPGGRAWLGLINMANEAVYPAMDTLVGEICDVFASSPYIHVGCDEVNVGRVELAKQYPAFIEKHGFKNSEQVFAYYVKQMSESVKKHGKMAIVWEGAATDQADPKNLIVMMWTWPCDDAARQYAKAGFPLLNAPNYAFGGAQDVERRKILVGQPKFNYESDLYVYGPTEKARIDSTATVLGGQINDWESTWNYSLSAARICVPARNAAIWNAKQKRSYDEYAPRFTHTDALLGKLIQPVTITNKTDVTFDSDQPIQRLRADFFFVTPVTVTLACPLPGSTVRYTLDGTAPTAKSDIYSKPLVISKATTVRLAPFDAKGTQLAVEQRAIYLPVDYEKNLTTDKPITASATVNQNKPQYVNDGFVMMDIWRGWWEGGACPQWVKIDLQKPVKLNKVHVFPFYDGGRVYQYIVEVSTDDKTWTKVVDRSKNTDKATPAGHVDTFAPTDARYLRVTVLGNNANNSAHLIEVRAYEAK